MSDESARPGDDDRLSRRSIGRRRLLTGALWAGAAGVLHACSSKAVSTRGAVTSAASTSTSTGTSTSTSTSTSTTASTSTSTSILPATPSAAANPEPPAEALEPAGGTDEISDAATVGERAERAEPPTHGGTYDREALYVALYGFPCSHTLGSLGEQDVDASVRRAVEVARPYQAFGRRVVPTFEILASVASSSAGADGDYSNEFDPSRFRAHLDAAGRADMHVVFDLQSGRARFPDQAREYEELWRFPHTSIALDPEWRVGPTERPGGGFIGSVDASEVNETIDYLDALVRRFQLPPKMCIVHQFTPSMITNKQLIRGTELVQVVIQMDGFGTLELKRGSWSRTVADLPDDAFAGWKNFYDEDRPTPSPAETMANEPTPRYVSYQ
jgi:hypothetical protein